MMRGILIAFAFSFFPTEGGALDMPVPVGARLIADHKEALSTYRLPVGPWDGTAVPNVVLEGQVTRQSFRMEGEPVTTLQIISPLRESLEAQGYEIAFECRSRACGGFDFRFGIDILQAPDMYVDLRDFRFLSARGENGQGVSILVSRSQSAAHVQIISVEPSEAEQVETELRSDNPLEAMNAPDALGDAFASSGKIILGGLDFGTGDADLPGSRYESIAELAAFLAENPETRIALVGHTDTSGSPERNLEVSRDRAIAVRDRLVETYGIDAARVEATGVGYLSPIATNLTEAGREQNRRVEAVLLSGE